MGKASRRKRVRSIEISRKPASTGLEHRLKSFMQHNKIAVRSLCIFTVCAGLSIFAYTTLLDTNSLTPLLSLTARSTGFVLDILGANVDVDGVLISSDDFSMSIVSECTGIIIMLILLSAILAFPSTASHKALGIATGIPILFLLNLIRTVSLFYIGTSFPSLFDTAHLLVWQSLMILAAIAIWLTWMRRAAHVSA